MLRGPVRALLFDVDGTLVDSDPLWRIACADIFERRCGIRCDDQYYDNHVRGRNNADIQATILAHIPADESVSILADVERAFRQLVARNLTAIRGAHSLISWARAHHIAVAAVTNADEESLAHMLRSLGFCDETAITLNGGCRGQLGGFDVVVIAGKDTTEVKPHPEPYQLAVSLLGVSSGDVIVFEDSSSGVRSAVAAKCLTVGVTSTLTAAQLIAMGCHSAIADFDQFDRAICLGE